MQFGLVVNLIRGISRSGKVWEKERRVQNFFWNFQTFDYLVFDNKRVRI